MLNGKYAETPHFQKMRKAICFSLSEEGYHIRDKRTATAVTCAAIDRPGVSPREIYESLIRSGDNGQ